jgi:hypothetical protein
MLTKTRHKRAWMWAGKEKKVQRSVRSKKWRIGKGRHGFSCPHPSPTHFSSNEGGYLLKVAGSEAACLRDQQNATPLIFCENQHLSVEEQLENW